MNASSSSSAATPIAMPEIESMDTILTAPEWARLQICRNATGGTTGQITGAA